MAQGGFLLHTYLSVICMEQATEPFEQYEGGSRPPCTNGRLLDRAGVLSLYLGPVNLPLRCTSYSQNRAALERKRLAVHGLFFNPSPCGRSLLLCTYQVRGPVLLTRGDSWEKIDSARFRTPHI